MNKTDVSIVECDIELKNGQLCGVQAIGRCATCERAFCPTHQGREYNGFQQLVPYFDMCALCVAVKQAEEAKRKQEAEAPREYFRSGAARTALLTSGVQPVKIYGIDRVWKTRLFGLGGRYVDVVTRGWILGEFKWKYSVTVHTGGPNEYKKVVEKWLTALLDLSPDDERLHIHSMYNSTLARVRPYSGGYEVLGLGRNDRFVGDEHWANGWAWREAAQAVKRLARLSS